MKPRPRATISDCNSPHSDNPAKTHPMIDAAPNVDASEIHKFEAIASRWWDPESEFKPLHQINPLRLGYVQSHAPVAGKTLGEPTKVGLNYGAPTVMFRLADNWHLEGEFLTSVTEVGFSVGGGGELIIGDPYGSRLELGAESVQVFGTRFYSKLAIRASDHIILSPIIEVSNMPHADNYGVRLIGQIGVDLGHGFTVAARGGYQARKSTSGGPSGGGTLSYAF